MKADFEDFSPSGDARPPDGRLRLLAFLIAGAVVAVAAVVILRN